MSDIKLESIRLTYKQRTWILAYRLTGTPRPRSDPFCQLLTELLAQPPAAEPNLNRWARLFPDIKRGNNPKP